MLQKSMKRPGRIDGGGEEAGLREGHFYRKYLTIKFIIVSFCIRHYMYITSFKPCKISELTSCIITHLLKIRLKEA